MHLPVFKGCLDLVSFSSIDKAMINCEFMLAAAAKDKTTQKEFKKRFETPNIPQGLEEIEERKAAANTSFSLAVRSEGLPPAVPALL